MTWFYEHPEPGIIGFGLAGRFAIVLECRPPIWWLPQMYTMPDKKYPDKIGIWTIGWLLFALRIMYRVDRKVIPK